MGKHVFDYFNGPYFQSRRDFTKRVLRSSDDRCSPSHIPRGQLVPGLMQCYQSQSWTGGIGSLGPSLMVHVKIIDRPSFVINIVLLKHQLLILSIYDFWKRFVLPNGPPSGQ